jgi:hypothetical protein
LGIALKPTTRLGHPVQFGFTVVAKGWVTQVVGQTRGIDQVRVSAQSRT